MTVHPASGYIGDMHKQASIVSEEASRWPEIKVALISGMLAGLAGLIIFLIIHALWIMPIWFILPIGMIISLLGGLAVGWAYHEVSDKLPPRPWRIPAIIGLISLILLPATLLAELRTAMFVLTPAGPVFQMSVARAVFIFLSELLLTASVTGGFLGWWLGRSWRAAGAMALAGFIFALGPGHNIPFIGGTGGVGKEWTIMGLVILTSALVLVEVHFRFLPSVENPLEV